MVTIDQSAANWRNTQTQADRTHPLTHLHQHSYNHWLCAKLKLSYYRNWNQIYILKVPEGGGENWSTQRKNPDSLPANWYHIIIRGENPTSHTGLEPSPSNIGDFCLFVSLLNV